MATTPRLPPCSQDRKAPRRKPHGSSVRCTTRPASLYREPVEARGSDGGERPRGARRREAGWILVLGIAIGILARPDRWFADAAAREPWGGDPAGVPAELRERVPPEEPPANGLVTLRLHLPPESAAGLASLRRTALERGLLAPGAKLPFPARLEWGGRSLAAEVRLKGDWTDHLEGRQWSLRIRMLADRCLGMREFSIQAPRTRDHLWEWLVHASGRREGLLAPRSTFVNVVQNGHAMGVYFLEEHFTRELLESSGRREGPIVFWDEDTLWNAYLRRGAHPALPPSEASRVSAVAESVDPAEIRAYDEKRLAADPALEHALRAARTALDELRALALPSLPDTHPGRARSARIELGVRALEELVDVDSLAGAHALYSVFQAVHPLVWHNMRFYYDPVQARLEPILFDVMAGTNVVREPVPERAVGLVAEFAASRAYVDGLRLRLARMLEPGWMEELFEELGPELARFEQALRAEGSLPPARGVDAMRERLRVQLEHLRAR
jgi:hypothetical protein